MAVNKVLVVDDSPADLANLRGIVSDTGVEVITATGGMECIQKAKSERPDLIFLDIIMPDMDGFEACRKLTSDADTKDIPVVFVTSKKEKADRVWAQMQGGKGLVSKPFTAEQIIEHINMY
jgi:twitching motility two-component system response regulator PilH